MLPSFFVLFIYFSFITYAQKNLVLINILFYTGKFVPLAFGFKCAKYKPAQKLDPS